MAETLYTVQWLGAGQFSQGQTFTEEEGGPWLPKWLRNGSVAEATPEEAKAYKEAQALMTPEEVAAGLEPARSSALATGDIDDVPPAADEVEGGSSGASAKGKGK